MRPHERLVPDHGCKTQRLYPLCLGAVFWRKLDTKNEIGWKINLTAQIKDGRKRRLKGNHLLVVMIPGDTVELTLEVVEPALQRWYSKAKATQDPRRVSDEEEAELIDHKPFRPDRKVGQPGLARRFRKPEFAK